MVKAVVIVVAVLFAVARFTMPSHPPNGTGTYEAFAHLFVGALIGAGFMDTSWDSRGGVYGWYGRILSSPWLWTAAALSAVEVVAFFLKSH